MNKRLINFFKLSIVFSLAIYIISNTVIKAERNSSEIRITNQAGESVVLYKQSHALIIWVRDYQHWPSLEAVPKGANLLEEALNKRGFNVIVEANPNSQKLREVVNDFIGQYGYDKNNRLVIFFAGHGWTIDGTDGYLVPSDTPDPMIDERGFFRLAISMEDVMAWAKRIKANHTLFLFDSCFSGTLFETKTRPNLNDAYIRTLTAKPVRQFLTAGDAGEEVPASNDFVELFIRGLDGEADFNKDGYVTGLEIGTFVQTNLPTLTENAQSPQYGKIRHVKLSQGDIVFRSLISPSIDTVRQLAPSQTTIKTTDQAQTILQNIVKATGKKPAIIYVRFIPSRDYFPNIEEYFERTEALLTQEYEKELNLEKKDTLPSIDFEANPEDKLDFLVITSEGEPIRVQTGVTRKEVIEVGQELYIEITDEIYSFDSNYRNSATKLYNWLVAPVEKKLEQEEIDNLLFIVPKELRIIPIAALYDQANQQFLVEKYSIGFAPSLNLNKNTYRSVKDLKLLAMGASEFKDPEMAPIPGVKEELSTITSIWGGKPSQSDQDFFINQDFTVAKFLNILGQQDYSIIHFATHTDFQPGNVENAYIQFYDSRLDIQSLRSLDFNDPVVELLVFSSCMTAVGNEHIPLGFAGLAVNEGVKTALGSLWYVSDEATVELMRNFYTELKTQPIKAEALRQAQLSLLKGEEEEFNHPYYWSSFNMVGNPW